MQKEITIKVVVSEGFANKVLKGPSGPIKPDEKTFDEKVDLVVAKYMNPLYKAMASYAIEEQKAQALAQVKQAEEQATQAAKELVVITKDENTSN